LAQTAGRVIVVWNMALALFCHCAAETSFAEEKRDLLEKTNVSGTLNALKFATESKCYFFHHVSTAYIAGKRHGICKEEYLPQTQFYNPYEETKHKAEGLVLKICNREGIRSNIYRPSIIYGDSKSGKCSKFDTFYFAGKLINSLKAIYEKDIIENKGLNAEKLGIKKDDDGRLFLPLRIEDIEGSSINAVSIDFVVNGCLAIMENCLDSDIFHLVNKNPKTLDELIVFVERLLNVRGIKPIPGEDFHILPQNSLEKMLDPYINVYRPYLCDDRIFEDKKSAKILQKNNIVCPNLNHEIASKCFQYAIEVDWGNKVFDSADSFDDPPADWFIK
jgi:nucleoside-diphosphate-sugar epimerase